MTEAELRVSEQAKRIVSGVCSGGTVQSTTAGTATIRCFCHRLRETAARCWPSTFSRRLSTVRGSGWLTQARRTTPRIQLKTTPALRTKAYCRKRWMFLCIISATCREAVQDSPQRRRIRWPLFRGGRAPRARRRDHDLSVSAQSGGDRDCREMGRTTGFLGLPD